MFDTKLRTTFSAAGVWYKRFERPISSISLVGGFAFDALSLKRLDAFWENFWVVAHLVVVAACIVLINRGEEHTHLKESKPREHFWLVNTLQFFLGGLLSTFLVFYFRSATLSVSWPFLLMLAAAFIANESLKKHYEQLSFQISLFYFSLLLFAIYMVPILVHRIGPLIFLLSGFTSLILLAVFVNILRYFAKDEFSKATRILLRSIGVMYLTINLLYFFNLIPPIPLSLRDAGIYHSIARQADGNYVVQTENHGLFGFFKLRDEVHAVSSSPLFAYSAVFSPTALRTDIVHEWQWYDVRSRRWVTESRVELPLVGGRDGGYRTYSMKKGAMPGLWRVNVETPRGQVLGRLKFNIVAGDPESLLRTEIKN